MRSQSDTGRPAGRMTTSAEAGVTFLELIIAVAMIVVIAFMTMAMSKTGADAQDYAQRQRRVTEVTQSISDRVREDILASVKLFSNDTLGNAYVTSLLDRTGIPAPLGDSRLPTIEDFGIFDAEGGTGGTVTGNQLLIGRFAWSDEFETLSGEVYRIDVYRIVHYYLGAIGTGPAAGSPGGIDIIRWVSEPIADASQIEAIADPVDQAEFCEHLRTASADRFGVVHAPVEMVWLVGGTPGVAGTLQQITAGGTLEATPQSPRSGAEHVILPDLDLSDTGMLDPRHHAVASNFAPASCRVSEFADQSMTGDGFPHGFETQIIGPTSARQILIHLSLVSSRSGRLATQNIQQVVDARDS